MLLYLWLLVDGARGTLRSRRNPVLENVALRHQLAVLARSSRPRRLQLADRLLAKIPGAQFHEYSDPAMGRGSRCYAHSWGSPTPAPTRIAQHSSSSANAAVASARAARSTGWSFGRDRDAAPSSVAGHSQTSNALSAMGQGNQANANPGVDRRDFAGV